jgi:hypothetical protein
MTKYYDAYIQSLADSAINQITKDKDGFLNSLNPIVRSTASTIYERYEDFYVPKTDIVG